MSLSASVASESAPSAIERVPGTEAMASEAEPQTGVRERLLRKKPWRLTAQGKLRLEQKKATADLAQQFGCDLQWQHVPKDIYSGMPYKTLFELVREGLTSYREQYIGDLVRDGIISEARRIGGCIVFPPTAVAQIRNREERSKTGKLRARNGGRTPGSDKRQVDLSRRSRSA